MQPGGAVVVYQNLAADRTRPRPDPLLDPARSAAIGIALAAGLAAFVAAAALRPVRRLTAAAENVATTGSLTARVQAGGHDELGRLAARFNEMLAALERSVGAQRRLVADASHELRTPLTAARTNVDLRPRGEASRAAR